MQIVTDSGADLSLTPEEMGELHIHTVPLLVTLEGQSYQEGINIEPEAFYSLLEISQEVPSISPPSAGELVNVYRELAATDPEILSIHSSSGLSGAVDAARLAASSVIEANVTVVDSKTLSAATGWQVEAAARTAQAGWALARILTLLEQIGRATDILYSLRDPERQASEHSSSRLPSRLTSMLNIKPLMGIEKQSGTYVQLGRTRTFDGALARIVELVIKQHEPGSSLRLQVLQANNPEGAASLERKFEARFDCHWRPVGPVSFLLGAQAGPGLVAVTYAPEAVFTQVP